MHAWAGWIALLTIYPFPQATVLVISPLGDVQSREQIIYIFFLQMAVGAMPAATNRAYGVMKIPEIIHNEPPRLLVLFDTGEDEITSMVADVLGCTYGLAHQLESAQDWSEEVVVLGVESGSIMATDALRDMGRTVIATHCVDSRQEGSDESLTDCYDYEYLYTKTALIRHDLARFLAFVLGQYKPHEELRKKARTTMLSTTFSDIRAALPNMGILSVGADAVELRVDLLREPGGDKAHFEAVPGLQYVGEQVMLLRQRTELPIVFTTRCTRENGRFPMEDPELYYTYLRKAIQWGCEYIDVELWLPEDIRRKLAAEKGHSKIISAWHDFSGRFKWTSPVAHSIFHESALYGDIVKMIALVSDVEDNYELEFFRHSVQGPSFPLFSGLNMSAAGQLSRTLNRVFTPITHPLMPMIAAPGQLSAAEINSMLQSLGQKPELEVYAVGRVLDNGHAKFLEKCLNEVSLPHRLLCVDQPQTCSIQSYIAKAQFGGAYINPPLPVELAPYLPTLTEAASTIGQVDTIFVQTTVHSSRTLIADNVSWKGIRATLTKDFIPSAFPGRSAIVLASSEAQAAAAMYALTSLHIASIYTIGFQSAGHKQLQGLVDLDLVHEPLAVISALQVERSMAAVPVLKHYTRTLHRRRHHTQCISSQGKIFIDLAHGAVHHQSNGSGNGNGNGNTVSIAETLGWKTFTYADCIAWTIGEAFRGLVGENVSCDFVRLAAGRGLYM